MARKQSLSSAFAELEKIVQELEKGEMNLEEATKFYKEGLVLADFLKKRLKEIKNEIKEIKGPD